MAYEDIAEIAEVNRPSDVNLYLDAGYRLLAIEARSWSKLHATNAQSFVARGTTYVLGRTADIEHYEPPAKVAEAS